MDKNDSMGFVETIGLAAAIAAADVMVKSANVKIETVANADSGLITVICTGDLASVNAAVDAGKAAVAQMGTVFNSNNIPRPSGDTQVLAGEYIGNILNTGAADKPKAPAKPSTRKTKK